MKTPKPYSCILMQLPPEKQAIARQVAERINPANALAPARMAMTPIVGGGVPTIEPPARLVLFDASYWGIGGVDLTVGFMETISTELRERILEHFNIWGRYCNARFVYSTSSPHVRISRDTWGYWSYLGTDILTVSAVLPTMSLGGFTMSYPESEFKRVIRHEVGHTMGFHHEQLRAEIVERLDEEATIEYFANVYGWPEDRTRFNVLTPLDPDDITASASADERSIMCYQLPAEITLDNTAIPGGKDITATDAAFAQTVYPGIANPAPPPPPPPPSGFEEGILVGDITWVSRPVPQNSAVEFGYPSSGLDTYIEFPNAQLGVAGAFSLFTSIKLQELPPGGCSFALAYLGDDQEVISLDVNSGEVTEFENTEIAIVFYGSITIVSSQETSYFNRLMVCLVGRSKKTGKLECIARVSDDVLLEEDEWFTLGVTYSGSGTRAGIKLYHNGLPITNNDGASFSSKGLVKTNFVDAEASMKSLCGMGAGSPATGSSTTGGFQGGIVERLAFFGKALTAKAMKKLHDDQVIADNEDISSGVFAKFLIDEGVGDTTTSLDGTRTLTLEGFNQEQDVRWMSLGKGKYSVQFYAACMRDRLGTEIPDLIGSDGTSPFSFLMRIKALPLQPGYEKGINFFGRLAELGPTSLDNSYFFKSQEAASPRGIEFTIISEGATTVDPFGQLNPPYVWTRSSTRLARNVWTVVGITYDGSLTAQGVELYTNGTKLKVSRTTHGSPTFSSGTPGDAPFLMGNELCEIDWFQIWDRVLTPNEMKAASIVDPSGWSPEDEALTERLKGYFRFIEGEGDTTAAHSGEVITTGTLTGMSWDVRSPDFAVRSSSGLPAVNFGTVTNLIPAPPGGVTLEAGYSAFSVFFQYKMAGDQLIALSLGSDGNQVLIMSHTLVFTLISVGDVGFGTPPNVRLNTLGLVTPTDTWHSACFTYDGSGSWAGMRMFSNGLEPAKRIDVTTSNGFLNDLLSSGDLKFSVNNGVVISLDNVGFWSRALSPAEITYLHNNPNKL
jgi:hypothetical protein